MTTDLEATTSRDRLLESLPVRDRRIELAGMSTAVVEAGDGPPVVLLHGPGASAAHWAPVIAGLAPDHRVIAPDLPGQGASTVNGSLDAERVVRWLAELLERTCASPPVLVGYTLGGAIAARFAARHGDRLRRLVLVDAFGLVPFAPAPEFGGALQRYLGDPSERSHDDLWRYCAADIDGLRERMGDRWRLFAAHNVENARNPDAAAALGELMEHFAMPEIPATELDRITVPTALIWGREDLATPVAVAVDAAERRGWPVRVIDGVADDPPVERPEAFLAALRPALAAAELRGRMLVPGDDGFADATSVWNGLIAKSPAHVVQPADVADVVTAVTLARDIGVPLTIRGGGHHIAGLALADGGVTIDMSGLRGVAVDPAARTVTVQPGCRLADVDRETQRHGLATPLGFISEVGVAGLTLGGGLGYLTRRFGWTVDNLLEVEIVTADGSVRRAARDEHPDLFWGVRGAGAALGAVTSFTFRVHEVGPTVYGGLIAWPFDRAQEIQEAYRALTAEAPRELAVWMNLIRAPAAPFVPAQWQGERICAMSVCFSGDLAEAAAAVAPIRALGDPVIDLLRELPYTEQQSYLDAAEPKGDHYYWKTGYVDELTDELLETLRGVAAGCPIPRAQIGVLHLAGALNERPGDDGVVGNRDARFLCGAIGIWEPYVPGGPGFERWIRGAWERLEPFSTGGSYINFQTADEGPDRFRAAYGANYDRLLELKRAYDPGGVFRSIRAS